MANVHTCVTEAKIVALSLFLCPELGMMVTKQAVTVLSLVYLYYWSIKYNYMFDVIYIVFKAQARSSEETAFTIIILKFIFYLRKVTIATSS